jgi:hypothetical protein
MIYNFDNYYNCKNLVHVRCKFFKMSKVNHLTIFYPFSSNLNFYNLKKINSNIIQKHYMHVLKWLLIQNVVLIPKVNFK